MHFIDLFVIPCFWCAFREMHDELHTVRIHFSSINRRKGIRFVSMDNFSKLKARFLCDFIDIRDEVVSKKNSPLHVAWLYESILPEHLLRKLSTSPPYCRDQIRIRWLHLCDFKPSDILGSVLEIRRICKYQFSLSFFIFSNPLGSLNYTLY
jgi:hypothetical protein